MAKSKVKPKSDKAKLAAGANEIKKAQKELATKTAVIEPVVLPKVTRSMQDIITDRVTVLPGSVGVKLADETPIEESLVVLDWATQMSDHVGFIIGDVLNFGQSKWGEKYTAALNQTNRAYKTLRDYASVAARITPDKRQSALSYSAHRTILQIGDTDKVDAVLREVGAQAEKGQEPSVKELRIKVQKLTPRSRKAPKKITSGGKKKGKARQPELPPYEPTADEQSKLDEAEDALELAAEAIKTAKLYSIVAKLDNKEKKRWMEMSEPIVTFYNAVDRVRGY
jgi:hypothetical protein